MVAFGPTSYVLPEIPEVWISSKMYLIIGTSGGIETDDVVETVESVKMGEERGIHTWGSNVLIELVGGRGWIDVIRIMEVIGEVVIYDVGGVNEGGGRDVVKFRNGFCMML